MARPERNNVDYFPFLCKEGKSMFYIEEKYGNDGFAAWMKILRQLAVNNYHYINLSEKVEIMFLSSKCKVSEEVLISIINDLCDLGEFNHDLWDENKIIWSEKFIGHIQDAYNKRKNKCITYEGLLSLLCGLGIRKPSKQTLKEGINTQSKVKKSKEKESKVNNSLFSFQKSMCEYGFNSSLVDDFLKNRKLKKLSNTKTAYDGLIREIEKANQDKDELLRMIIEKGWGGFKSDWIEKKEVTDNSNFIY